MIGVREVNNEVKKLASEKIAQVRIYNLHLMAEIIDLAISRGAFRGAEASQVGALFDILTGAINRAYDITEDEIKKANEIKKADENKLPSISEN